MKHLLMWYINTIFLTTFVSSHCVKAKFCTPCWQSPNHQYTLACQLPDDQEASRFQVLYKVGDYMYLDCYGNDPPWSVFQFEKDETLSYSVKSTRMSFCKFPANMSVSEVIRLFVTGNVTKLEFVSFTQSSRKPTREDFANLTSLEKLLLPYNLLHDIPADLLHDLTNLKHLDLANNRLEKLPIEFFDLPNLEYLDLTDNYFKILEPNQFNGLLKLKQLSLENNQLAELTPSIFENLTSLTHLNLTGNNIEYLDDEIFSELKALKVMNLGGNNFTEEGLPPGLFRHNAALETVTVSYNKRPLASVPRGWFMNLPNLFFVKVSFLGLVEVPRDLFAGARSLTYLSLADNKIREIPEGFLSDCESLTHITLSHNEITHLPVDMFYFSLSLKSVDLSYNQLKVFNSKLLDTTAFLEILRLENNRIETIREESQCFDADFGLFPQFKKGTHDMSYYCPKNLLEVHLDGNELTAVPKKLIVSDHLRLLQLDRNRIKNITMDDFQSFAGITEVSVDNNQIETISMAHLEVLSRDDFPKKVELSLGSNPINCDCRIHDFMKFVQSNQVVGPNQTISFEMDNTYCANPPELRSIRLKELDRMALKCLVEDPSTLNATCPEKCQCWNRPEDQGYLIDCSYRNLTKAPESLQSPEGYHIELNLTGNLIRNMPSMMQPGYLGVTKLILSNNIISAISLQSLSDNLEVLTLDSNNLTKLDAHVLDFLNNSTKLPHLELHGNPWICNCDTVDFLKFIQAEIPKNVDLRKVTCESSDYPIFQMAPEDICPVFIGSIIIIGSIIAILGILVGTIAAVYYRYQHEIKVWLYAKQWCLWLITEDELDKDKEYDAFISFSHLDEIFVTQTLMPTLEEGAHPFRLCVHYRDWIPGEPIPTQIIHSVESSRRTIVVLSPNFLESVWSRIEFRAAHEQALSEGRARVIIILLGDIGPIDNLDAELKAYLKMNTYVKWGDPWFWKKLNYALPHSTHMHKTKKSKLSVVGLLNEKVQYFNNKNTTNTTNSISNIHITS